MRIIEKCEVLQGIGVFLFMGFGGFLYQALELWQWGVDVGRNSPLLAAVFFLLLFVLWCGWVLINPGRKKCYRIKKKILKIDRGGVGLMVLLFIVGLWGMKIGVQAKEIRDKLPIVVYDETGHKVLWENEEINVLTGDFRSEIPK